MADMWLSVVYYDNKDGLRVTTTPGDPAYLVSKGTWLVHYSDPMPSWRAVRIAAAGEDPALGCQELQAAYPAATVEHAVMPPGYLFPMTPGTHPVVPHHTCP